MRDSHVARAVLAFALACVVLGSASLAWAQRWSWPEEPKNLQVLEGVKGEELGSLMRGYTRALGVRCNHCHVGEDGQPLSSFDFVSDANPNKDRARAMIRMLGEVKTRLAAIEPSAEPRVEMGCQTCHRGVTRPMTLAEELGNTYRAQGTDATLAHYAELREAYYGRGAYDFDESALDAVGHTALEAGDVEGALAVLERNAQEHPESSRVWSSLAGVSEAQGDTARAIELYRKAVELDPRNRHAQQKLKELAGE